MVMIVLGFSHSLGSWGLDMGRTSAACVRGNVEFVPQVMEVSSDSLLSESCVALEWKIEMYNCDKC